MHSLYEEPCNTETNNIRNEKWIILKPYYHLHIPRLQRIMNNKDIKQLPLT